MKLYYDQCGPRIRKRYLIDEEYSQSDLRYISSIHQQIMSKDDHNQPSTSISDAATAVDECSDSVSNSDSSEFSPPPAKGPIIQNRQDRTNLAPMCKRFDVSDCGGAAIASAVLKDFSMIDDKTLTKVIDRSELRQEHQKCKQKLREDEECNHKIGIAIYVDGRKDATPTTIKTSHSKVYGKIENEAHYVIVGEHEELYLTHFSVEMGKGVTIAKATYKA